MAEGDEEIFIMGGAQIYGIALDVADRMYITRVERDYEGDTSFPEIDYSEWQEVAREEFSKGEEYDAPFTLIDLERKSVWLRLKVWIRPTSLITLLVAIVPNVITCETWSLPYLSSTYLKTL